MTDGGEGESCDPGEDVGPEEEIQTQISSNTSVESEKH